MIRIVGKKAAWLLPLRASAFLLAAAWVPLFSAHSSGQSIASTGLQQSQPLAPISPDGTVLSQAAASQGPPAKQTAATTPDGTGLPGAPGEEDKQADDDLGEQWVMKHNERIQPCNLFADVSLFHTSNVALGHDLELADWFLVATVGASYTRPFSKIWAVNVGISDTQFRYDRFSEFDFNSFTVGAGISVQAHSLWDSIWSLQYSYNLLNGRESAGQLFSGHSFSLTGTKSVRLSSADNLAFGIGGAFNLADPSTLDRGDVSVFASYTLGVTRHLSVGATLRESFLAYTDGPRRDFAHSLALSGRYVFNRWFSLGATVAGTFNQSNEPAFEYKVLNLGCSVSASLQF